MVFVKYCVKFYTVIFYTCLGASGWALARTVFGCRVNYEHVECLSIVFLPRKKSSGCPRDVRVLYGVQKKLRFLLNMVRGVRRILAMTPWMMIDNPSANDEPCLGLGSVVSHLVRNGSSRSITYDLLPCGWRVHGGENYSELDTWFENSETSAASVINADRTAHIRGGAGKFSAQLNAFDGFNAAEKYGGCGDEEQLDIEFHIQHKVIVGDHSVYKGREQ